MASVIDTVVNLCKRRGLVYQAGDIYGGSRSAWDYGPLGVELKENIKRQWWRHMVTSRPDVVGVDTSIIQPRQVWVTSGHVEVFTDPLVESLHTHRRYRADHLLEAYEEKHGHPPENGLADINDPETGQPGNWTEPKPFSGLLKTFLGPVDDEEGLHYLRPETAQGIFINFKNVMTSARMKPPFGIANIGKSFRNEITPGNFIFRTREFEQMEMEFFVKPGEDEEWHQKWIDDRLQWYIDLGISPDNLRLFEHPQEKLSHYSKRTVDVEYAYNFAGTKWGELEGIANRTDYDLRVHSEGSGEDLSYFDQESNERWIPFVIEPAAGLGRAFMAFLVDAYTEDEAPNSKGGVDKRVVLRLDRRLAPVKVAVLPLSKKPELSGPAEKIAADLRKLWNIEYDTSGAIGRRYRRQDEIGTPFCVTVDFDTLEDNAVTVRERDSMEQERVPLDELQGYLAQRLIGC
ncbi:glycine--tRNA ligase [Corynebacterium comes]|uniref:Glycine--tRNA ligase n=1 Tax=Corynebacterium comes TaxID=2675218 RepID=A0A6B8W2P3_9CORY|nr:glycine--tRNA ligase [Corynebacterium comes]QGU05186.1 Glycine--tRNA ligase [Corynebacterium comes]